ncbi:hypothetical protein ACFPM7_06475 [Actinokineospora guangxiensis]|uniref:Septum formation initiator n=1 Tax=Actinokineospora guangxiensis TaxID=1490288 RepID=A0ABW0EIY8_9PSEU
MKTGHVTTGVLLWCAAAGAGVLVGITAVDAIGTDFLGDGRAPLSASEVDALLAGRSALPPTTDATAMPSTSEPPTPRQLQTDTPGGTVISLCTTSGQVDILSATPAQGYRVESQDSDDDDGPSVTFTADDQEADDQDVEIRLRCADGVPIPEIRTDD